jgi:hypothetical protein
MISMKNLFFPSFLTLIFVSLCLTGCAGKAGKLMESAQASYRVNDYEAALRDSVMALKHKPDYEKAQNFAPTFFKAAVEVRQNKIKGLQASSSKFRWDGLVAEYKGLIEINGLVKSLPPLIHKKTKQRITFETQDYSTPLRQASENAAEAHYQEGIRLANSKPDVETQKKAAKEFKTAQDFVPGYKDAGIRYTQSRDAGVKRMAILTFEDKSGKARAYGALSETITDNIISNVISDPAATEFLDIISRDRLEQIMAEQNLSYTGRFDERTVASIGGVAGVHELVVGQITQIIYKDPNPKHRRWDRQKTIKVPSGTERYVDKNGNTKTRTKYSNQRVSARVTHTQVESSVTIVGSYKILDVKTGALKKAPNFTTKHEFSAEWAEATGREEALERSDRSLMALEQQDAPPEEEMVLEAANQLANKLAEELKAYAR